MIVINVGRTLAFLIVIKVGYDRDKRGKNHGPTPRSHCVAAWDRVLGFKVRNGVNSVARLKVGYMVHFSVDIVFVYCSRKTTHAQIYKYNRYQ